MTDDERRAFLLEGTRTAILATTREDGHPVATPIGFTLDGDDVMILTHEGSVKGRAVRRDPRLTLVVDDPTPPFRYVAIEGVAETTMEHNEARRAATAAIGRRYAGPDAGPEAVEQFAEYADANLKLLVRVRPTRIVARDRVGEN